MKNVLVETISEKCFKIIRINSINISNRCSYSSENFWIRCASFGPTKRAKLMISNEEINDVMKIVKSFEESGLLIKDSETIGNETKEQKGGFLSVLLGTLSPSLLQNLLIDKGTIKTGGGRIRNSQKF